jgi:hypothetical protein
MGKQTLYSFYYTWKIGQTDLVFRQLMSMAKMCLHTKYKHSRSKSTWDMTNNKSNRAMLWPEQWWWWPWPTLHMKRRSRRPGFLSIKCRWLTGVYKPNINVPGQIVLEICPTKVLWHWPILHLKCRSHRPGFLSTSVDGQQVSTYQI